MTGVCSAVTAEALQERGMVCEYGMGMQGSEPDPSPRRCDGALDHSHMSQMTDNAYR